MLGPQWEGVLGPDRVWDEGHSLEETSLVLLLIVGPKLDLALEASELTGLVEGDRVGAIQDVIPCLQSTAKGGECCLGYRDTPTALLPLSLPPHARQVLSLPAHREGSAGQGPGSPHSGLSRRTSSGAEASRAPPLPVPSASGHGPASSLGHRGTLSLNVKPLEPLCHLISGCLFLHFLPSLSNMLSSASVGLCFTTDASPVFKQCLAKASIQ